MFIDFYRDEEEGRKGGREEEMEGNIDVREKHLSVTSSTGPNKGQELNLQRRCVS